MGIYDDLKRQKQALDVELSAAVRIALVGKGGSGKSSLVNALVGKEVCPIGVETDMTTEAKPVNHHGITFVDLPGYGTTRFPPDSFATEFRIDDYDLFICVANGKFLEEDEHFFNRYLKGKKPAILVRTHVDTLKQRGKSREELQADIAADVRTRFGQSAPLFFVDSVDGEGIATVQDAVYERLGAAKQQRWVCAAAILSEQMLARKRDIAERVVWANAGAAAANAINPVPGLDVSIDIAILVEMGVLIRRAYGLDEQSLRKYEAMAGAAAGLARVVLGYIGQDAIITLLKRVASRQIAKEAVKWVPVVGQAVAAMLGFGIAKLVGDQMVKDCHALAEEILREGLQLPPG